MTKPITDAIARKNWPQYDHLTNVYSFCEELAKKDIQIERLKKELQESWHHDRQNADRLCDEVRQREQAVRVLASLLAATQDQLSITKAELDRFAPRTP